MLGSQNLGLGSVDTASDADQVGPPGPPGPAGGVNSVNGRTGAVVVSTTRPGDSIATPSPTSIVIAGGGLAVVANVAALAALSATNFPVGNTLCWVSTVGAYFQLQISALTVDSITVVTASGVAGGQWLRLNMQSPIWQARTAWWMDPQNAAASDENDGGSSGAPLKTYAELARRLTHALFSANVTVNVVSDSIANDSAYFTCKSVVSGRLTFASTTIASGTPLYSGTVTSFTPQSVAMAADDNQLNDTGIPVSYTASGIMANNVILVRTNGTKTYWFAAKDLGAKTLRCSVPAAAAVAIANPIAGDSYSAYQLPKVPPIAFNHEAMIRGANMTEVTLSVAPLQIFQQWGSITRCCFDTGSNAPTFEVSSNIVNCMFDYGAATQGANFNGTGVLVGALSFGLQRSSGSTCAVEFYGSVWNAQGVTFQGCVVFVTTGIMLNVQGRLSFYDTTTDVMFADYWASVLFAVVSAFGAPGVCGKGNTGKLLKVQNWGNMAYINNVPTIAGASSDPSPISVGGATSAVAALPINKTLANDIGIFQTA